jgi:hypothetical protein
MNSNVPEEKLDFDINIEELQNELLSNSNEGNQGDWSDLPFNSPDLNYTPEKEVGSTITEGPDTSFLKEGDKILPSTKLDQPGTELSVYEAALNLLKENGLFTIPEDINQIDEDAWNKVLEYNKEVQRKNIIDDMRAKSDPRIMELFDYVNDGGTWFGFDDMRNAIQDETNIENLDVFNEEHQHYLIKSYLSDGLDPSNPAHARRLKSIDDEVNTYFERLEAEDLAKEAKKYFVDQVNARKQEIVYQQELHRRQEQQQQQEAARHQQEWIKNFQTTLTKRDWSQAKKDAVISQFDVVELEDGRSMEMWKYKFNAMWQKPEAVQIFMDFLSDFDHNTVEFKRNGIPSDKIATSTIQSLINSKNQQKSKGQTQSRQGGGTNQPILIDPLNM